MTPNPFTEKARRPTTESLRSALGSAWVAWERLLTRIAARIPPVEPAWGYTSAKTGWGLRVRREGRVILYMTPARGHFTASFALGEKAVDAAKAARLPRALLQAIDAAPRYAEGRGVRIRVTRESQVPGLAALAEIKHRS